MFQTERLPVKVYRGTDAGAPELNPAAGGLKTLLKACLVTGYGDGQERKEPLGWELPFEEIDRAAFRSADAKSNKHYFVIDNRTDNYAVLSAYTAMSGLDGGSGGFGYPDPGHNRFAYNVPQTSRRKWLVAGHARAFVFVLTGHANIDSLVLFFGDVPSLLPGDTGNTLYWHSNYGSATGFDTGPFKNQAMAAGRAVGQPRNVAVGLFPRSLYWDAQVAYPDPVNTGLSLSEIYFAEGPTPPAAAVRILCPALFCCQNNLTAVAEQTEFDIGQRVLMKLNVSDGLVAGSSFLLDLTAWEA